MSLGSRTNLYRQIEQYRKRPLIAYVTSKRPGVDALMASDAFPRLAEQLLKLPQRTKEADLLIVSNGGDPMVAWWIISMLRQRIGRIGVLIPQSAYSAATLLAIGADEIVMHPFGNLGPIDMQIVSHKGWFSTEDISAFFDFVRNDLSITDQDHLRNLFQDICKEIGTLGLGFSHRSSRLAVTLAEKLLVGRSIGGEGFSHKPLIEALSQQFHAHNYPINRTEAAGLGLPIAEADPKLEELLWRVWMDLEQELKEREPTSIITELLNSSEGAKLLAPVPMMPLPCNAPMPNYIQGSVQEVIQAGSVTVNPVDFEYLEAVLESPRLAFRRVKRGKILSFRLPDLTIQYNALNTFRGWERVPVPKGDQNGTRNRKRQRSSVAEPPISI
jgi:hypothetical protein